MMKKPSILVRLIAVIVAMAFSFESILWANPEVLHKKPAAATLQVLSPFDQANFERNLRLRVRSELIKIIYFIHDKEKIDDIIIDDDKIKEWNDPFTLIIKDTWIRFEFDEENPKGKYEEDGKIIVPCDVETSDGHKRKYEAIIYPGESITKVTLRKPGEKEIGDTNPSIQEATSNKPNEAAQLATSSPQISKDSPAKKQLSRKSNKITSLPYLILTGFIVFFVSYNSYLFLTIPSASVASCGIYIYYLTATAIIHLIAKHFLNPNNLDERFKLDINPLEEIVTLVKKLPMNILEELRKVGTPIAFLYLLNFINSGDPLFNFTFFIGLLAGTGFKFLKQHYRQESIRPRDLEKEFLVLAMPILTVVMGIAVSVGCAPLTKMPIRHDLAISAIVISVVHHFVVNTFTCIFRISSGVDLRYARIETRSSTKRAKKTGKQPQKRKMEPEVIIWDPGKKYVLFKELTYVLRVHAYYNYLVKIRPEKLSALKLILDDKQISIVALAMNRGKKVGIPIDAFDLDADGLPGEVKASTFSGYASYEVKRIFAAQGHPVECPISERTIEEGAEEKGKIKWSFTTNGLTCRFDNRSMETLNGKFNGETTLTPEHLKVIRYIGTARPRRIEIWGEVKTDPASMQLLFTFNVDEAGYPEGLGKGQKNCTLLGITNIGRRLGDQIRIEKDEQDEFSWGPVSYNMLGNYFRYLLEGRGIKNVQELIIKETPEGEGFKLEFIPIAYTAGEDPERKALKCEGVIHLDDKKVPLEAKKGQKRFSVMRLWGLRNRRKPGGGQPAKKPKAPPEKKANALDEAKAAFDAAFVVNTDLAAWTEKVETVLEPVSNVSSAVIIFRLNKLSDEAEGLGSKLDNAIKQCENLISAFTGEELTKRKRLLNFLYAQREQFFEYIQRLESQLFGDDPDLEASLSSTDTHTSHGDGDGGDGSNMTNGEVDVFLAGLSSGASRGSSVDFNGGLTYRDTGPLWPRNNGPESYDPFFFDPMPKLDGPGWPNKFLSSPLPPRSDQALRLPQINTITSATNLIQMLKRSFSDAIRKLWLRLHLDTNSGLVPLPAMVTPSGEIITIPPKSDQLDTTTVMFSKKNADKRKAKKKEEEKRRQRRRTQGKPKLTTKKGVVSGTQIIVPQKKLSPKKINLRSAIDQKIIQHLEEIRDLQLFGVATDFIGETSFFTSKGFSKRLLLDIIISWAARSGYRKKDKPIETEEEVEKLAEKFIQDVRSKQGQPIFCKEDLVRLNLSELQIPELNITVNLTDDNSILELNDALRRVRSEKRLIVGESSNAFGFFFAYGFAEEETELLKVRGDTEQRIPVITLLDDDVISPLAMILGQAQDDHITIFFRNIGKTFLRRAGSLVDGNLPDADSNELLTLFNIRSFKDCVRRRNEITEELSIVITAHELGHVSNALYSNISIGSAEDLYQELKEKAFSDVELNRVISIFPSIHELLANLAPEGVYQRILEIARKDPDMARRMLQYQRLIALGYKEEGSALLNSWHHEWELPILHRLLNEDDESLVENLELLLDELSTYEKIMNVFVNLFNAMKDGKLDRTGTLDYIATAKNEIEETITQFSPLDTEYIYVFSKAKLEIDIQDGDNRFKFPLMVDLLSGKPGYWDTMLVKGANRVMQKGEELLDLACGTGIASLAMASRAKRVVACDISDKEIEIARKNVDLNKHANVEVRQGDLFVPVEGEEFDVITCNPPAMPTPPDHEEIIVNQALTHEGGPDGWNLIDRIIPGVPKHLKPGGRFVLVYMEFLGYERAFTSMREVGLVPEILFEKETEVKPGGDVDKRKKHIEETLGYKFIERDGKVFYKTAVIVGRMPLSDRTAKSSTEQEQLFKVVYETNEKYVKHMLLAQGACASRNATLAWALLHRPDLKVKLVKSENPFHIFLLVEIVRSGKRFVVDILPLIEDRDTVVAAENEAASLAPEYADYVPFDEEELKGISALIGNDLSTVKQTHLPQNHWIGQERTEENTPLPSGSDTAEGSSKSWKSNVLSAIVSGRKVIAAFHRDLNKISEDHSMIIGAMKAWKERMGRKFPNLPIDNFIIVKEYGSQDELRDKLKNDHRIEISKLSSEKDIMLTFALEGAKPVALGSIIQPVYLTGLKGGAFSSEKHYWPIIEVMTVSVVKAHTRCTTQTIYDIFKRLGISREDMEKKMNIADIVEKDGALVVTIVGRAKKHDLENDCRNRHVFSMNFLRSS